MSPVLRVMMSHLLFPRVYKEVRFPSFCFSLIPLLTQLLLTTTQLLLVKQCLCLPSPLLILLRPSRPSRSVSMLLLVSVCRISSCLIYD